MKKIFFVLMALLLLTPIVSAGIVEDITSMIFTEEIKMTYDGNCTITESFIGEDKIDVSYRNTLINPNGTTLQMFCPDNTGNMMPVWGASITIPKGSYEFSKSEALIASTSGCYFGVDYGGAI